MPNTRTQEIVSELSRETGVSASEVEKVMRALGLEELIDTVTGPVGFTHATDVTRQNITIGFNQGRFIIGI